MIETMLDLEMEDWLDPSLPTNRGAIGCSF
jgi:hypothetical protein